MGALIDVRAPDGGTEGTRSQLLRWLKRPGEPIAALEPLAELETDKVTVELAAPATGVLRELLKQSADEVLPAEVIARIEADVGPAGACASPEPAPVSAATPLAPAVRAAPRRLLSPSVRRLLRERGLDPAQVRGTGRDGRITARDVGQWTPPAPASPAGAVTRVPHTPMRRRIAERMVESLLHTAPHVTTVFEADLSAVLADRAARRGRGDGPVPTLTAYFAVACARAVAVVPEVHARWTEDALELPPRLDLGIATSLGANGLVVPVLRDAGSLELTAIAARLAELTARARAGRLTPEDVRGATFTVSNHGVSGSLVATPIVIPQPQSAILGIGKVEKRVVVIRRDGEDAIAIRPRCYVSLTLDHRVLDGERANRFLQVLVEQLERWPG